MDTTLQTLRTLGIQADAIHILRQKDGVAVYRVAAGHTHYILKTYENKADLREIRNYRVLQTLGIRTLNVIGSTQDALLIEDIDQSDSLRLAVKADMDDTQVAIRLAAWYKTLHEHGKAYVAAHGQGMYDETDCITLSNMQAVARTTGTEQHPVWARLYSAFDTILRISGTVVRTLTYNDFYYTNMVVANDLSAAFMFDYNLLGKGYVYADLRNVTSSLGESAGQAFLKAYGHWNPAEEAFDAVASILTTLHFGCQRKVFPAWAAEELDKLKNGILEAAIRRLLTG